MTSDLCEYRSITIAHPLNTHGRGSHVCLRGEMWLYGLHNLGNVQAWLVLAARQCVDIQIETQRILKLFKIATEHANSWGKICDIFTLMKYMARCEI